MFGILTVKAGPDQGKMFTLVKGEVLSLGKDPRLLDRLRDPMLARVHCKVELVDGQAVITDCKGSTGTLVNGKPITSHVLQAEDVIHIGNTQLLFQWTSGDEGTTLRSSIFSEP